MEENGDELERPFPHGVRPHGALGVLAGREFRPAELVESGMEVLLDQWVGRDLLLLARPGFVGLKQLLGGHSLFGFFGVALAFAFAAATSAAVLAACA